MNADKSGVTEARGKLEPRVVNRELILSFSFPPSLSLSLRPSTFFCFAPAITQV